MQPRNNFKDFGLTPNYKPMIGDKIKIEKILNIPITICDYKIENSKYPEKGNGKCLYLQIQHNDSKRVVFTGSVILQDLVQRIPRERFPFDTIIIKENDAFIFS